MSQIAINAVLAQMRALEAVAKGGESSSVGGAGGSDFGKVLAESMNKINETQHNAKAMKADFQHGVEGVELPQVMVALQEASISFQAMTQVRNKLLSAYQDIMNMPV